MLYNICVTLLVGREWGSTTNGRAADQSYIRAGVYHTAYSCTKSQSSGKV